MLLATASKADTPHAEESAGAEQSLLQPGTKTKDQELAAMMIAAIFITLPKLNGENQ